MVSYIADSIWVKIDISRASSTNSRTQTEELNCPSIQNKTEQQYKCHKINIQVPQNSET